MTMDSTQIPGYQPKVEGDKVIVDRFQRRTVRNILQIMIEEELLEEGTVIPAPNLKGATELTPVLAASLALGLGAEAELEEANPVNPARASFLKKRALVFGQAALQAGKVQEPPLAVTDPGLHFELEDMVLELQGEQSDPGTL